MLCQLCNGQAALYCSSDSAFLCLNCDAKVHGANFLVARHIRRILCSNVNCTRLTSPPFSGHSFHLPRDSLCNSCSSPARVHHHTNSHQDSYSSSSSAESSSTAARNIQVSNTYTPTKWKLGAEQSKLSRSRVDWKAEGILVNWCNKLGLTPRTRSSSSSSSSNIVVEVACHAFAGFHKLRALPHRVGLAASLWFSLRLLQGNSWHHLKRLEEISGVPAKLIVAGHSKLARILIINKPRQLHQQQQEEGWAEC